MGIYIKGMEMPNNCWECHFGHEDMGMCVVDFKNHGDWDEPHDCPLIPVPPHGRLGDLDKIESKIAQLPPEDYTTGGIRLILDDAPTIIPAEEAHDE